MRPLERISLATSRASASAWPVAGACQAIARSGPRTIVERMALDLAHDLEAMPPDDQRRVIDLMKRLRGDRGEEETDNVPLGTDS